MEVTPLPHDRRWWMLDGIVEASENDDGGGGGDEPDPIDRWPGEIRSWGDDVILERGIDREVPPADDSDGGEGDPDDD